VLDDANAAAVLSTLGVTAFIQGMLDDANLSDWLTTMGLDADLATLAIPASLSISSFVETILDDADAAAALVSGSLERGWTYESQVSTASGSTAELATGLSSDIMAFDVLMNGVSTDNASNPPTIELGDSGGYDTSGYSANYYYQEGGVFAEGGDTEEIPLAHPTGWAAGQALYGFIRFRRWDASEHLWHYDGTFVHSGNTILYRENGFHTLSAALDRVRLSTLDSGASLDAGEARLRWK
jgi:hypothetical protein